MANKSTTYVTKNSKLNNYFKPEMMVAMKKKKKKNNKKKKKKKNQRQPTQCN